MISRAPPRPPHLAPALLHVVSTYRKLLRLPDYRPGPPARVRNLEFRGKGGLLTSERAIRVKKLEFRGARESRRSACGKGRGRELGFYEASDRAWTARAAEKPPSTPPAPLNSNFLTEIGGSRVRKGRFP